jgi:hypothetical protein
LGFLFGGGGSPVVPLLLSCLFYYNSDIYIKS